MATVTFLYRSARKKAPLTARLRFSIQGKKFIVDSKTLIIVEGRIWKTDVSRLRDVSDVNAKTDAVKASNKLRDFILEVVEDAHLPVSQDWLQDTIDAYYNPNINSENPVPTDLIGYIDYYLDYRQREISESNRKKVITVRNKILRFQSKLKTKIQIEDVNEKFRQELTRFNDKNQYSQNTQHREFVLIKTICKHARFLGVKTDPHLDGLNLKREATDNIFLNTDELQAIKDVDLPHDHLDNARDWLIISCYTGQRISDFMRFTSDMIHIENGRKFIEFTQKKTEKEMGVPVLKEVSAVLKKRNGEFPRKISHQRYNDYIKEVCKLAGINQRVKGKRRVSIAPKGRRTTLNDYRDVSGVFEKWEVVSSHIGRRSFATNYYGKVPTAFLIDITGHGSERMFLNYIKKSSKDLAVSSQEYFDKL